MDKSMILAKLAACEPLFDDIPTVAHKRIMGTESEYGVSTTLIENKPVVASERLPVMLTNGGEIYEDCGHIEYASPETANPAAAVAYYEAGKVHCWNAHYSPELWCNNNDWYGNTFGAHENYFTCAPRTTWRRLLPFLIARTALCGAGWYTQNGCFEISQRAHALSCAEGTTTTANRAIINLREEALAKVYGHDRLHLICGDANMSEISTFLRLGTTSCAVEMLELDALPTIAYHSEHAASDIQAVSQQKWTLQGVTSGPRTVLDILSAYHARAAELFSHRDRVTDTLLVIWEDTLEKLGRDPKLLWRRLDWVAKLYLRQLYEEQGENTNGLSTLHALDLAYHDLNPAKGLYYALAQSGTIERVVSDASIIRATHIPPADTRAYARGTIVRHLEEKGRHKVLCANSWDHLSIIDSAANGYPRVTRVPRPRHFISFNIPNPYKTYAHLAERVRKEFW